MFPRRYFAGAFFAAVYWPQSVAVPVPPIPPVTTGGGSGRIVQPWRPRSTRVGRLEPEPQRFVYDGRGLIELFGHAEVVGVFETQTEGAAMPEFEGRALLAMSHSPQMSISVFIALEPSAKSLLRTKEKRHEQDEQALLLLL